MIKMESSVGYESKQIDNLRENALINYFFKDLNGDQFREILYLWVLGLKRFMPRAERLTPKGK